MKKKILQILLSHIANQQDISGLNCHPGWKNVDETAESVREIQTFKLIPVHRKEVNMKNKRKAEGNFFLTLERSFCVTSLKDISR